jgi:hypothetical protein
MQAHTPTDNPAPVLFSRVLSHLEKVVCLDDDYKTVVAKLACNASNRLLAVQAVAMQLLRDESGIMSLSAILGSIRTCSAQDTPVPPFLVEFKENMVQSWSAQVMSAIRLKSGRVFCISDRALLMDALRSALESGLRHRHHATVVDSGRNPNWLCEYVRCICLIWKDGNGAVTPASVQYIRKLACCTPQSISMICEYAVLCVKESKAIHLSLQLSKMHGILRGSMSNCGISNSAARDCIRRVCLDEQSLDTLSKVETVLSDVWDLILNPDHEGDRSVMLAGIAGSHMPEFHLPANVVKHGSTSIIINCINSALPLSKINPPADDELLFFPQSMVSRKLCKDVCACLVEMCGDEQFGGADSNACCPEWWKEYKVGLQGAQEWVCEALGMRVHPSASAGESSSSPPTDTHSDLMELRVRRCEYARSTVSKVIMAGSIFDGVVACVLRGASPLRISMDGVSTICDPVTGEAKKNKSLAGRVFADIARITADRELSTEVFVDNKEQAMTMKSTKTAARVMNLLLEYMIEYSKSRRKRKDETLLRRNVKPCVDKRRK